MKEIIDIETLVRWVYTDQAADKVVQAGVRQIFPQGYRFGMAAILHHEQLGTKIDCAGSAAYATRDVHPDAEAVHDAVMRLAPMERGLVVTHAKSDDRPDAMVGERPHLGPVLKGNGEVREHRENGRPVYCYIEWKVRQENIDFARGVYSAWWDALAWLADELADDLDDYMVTGPAAPQCPWQQKRFDAAKNL